eukprot:TRINITY_DN2157_c3_g1_i1.p1 TRINITY_DN2157_c3_g1~~TRINITY_DN2157_c3_g1_i1.p1  ORF type:complete len:450 (+),score=151.31 TRINITY_DN2157_c3_g1_i1:88-1437(+)
MFMNKHSSIFFIFIYLFTLNYCYDFPYHSNIKYKTGYFGPFTIPGLHGTNGQDMENMFTSEFTPGPFVDTDLDSIGIVDFNSRMCDSEKNHVTQDHAYLHHIIFVTFQYDNNIGCPDWAGRNGAYNIPFASGQEYSDVKLPYPYAYEMMLNEQWFSQVEIMNPNQGDVEVYVEYTFGYIELSEDIKKVRSFFKSITGCGDVEFDLSPKSMGTDYRVPTILDFQSSFSGLLVELRGHLHRGGKNIYLTNMKTGEIIFNSIAHYDDREHPEWLTRNDIQYPDYQINIGDQLRLVSVYSNDSVMEAMAILIGFVYVEDYITYDTPMYGGEFNPFSDRASILILSSEEEEEGHQESTEQDDNYVEIPEEEDDFLNENEETGDNEDNNDNDDDNDNSHTTLLFILACAGILGAVVVAISGYLLYRYKYKYTTPEIIDKSKDNLEETETEEESNA